MNWYTDIKNKILKIKKNILFWYIYVKNILKKITIIRIYTTIIFSFEL